MFTANPAPLNANIGPDQRSPIGGNNFLTNGGAGGYSGRGGGREGGGGGGSFLDASAFDTTVTAGEKSGNGEVVINLQSASGSVPEPGSLALLRGGLGRLAAIRRRIAAGRQARPAPC
jgi:hypothetical protein